MKSISIFTCITISLFLFNMSAGQSDKVYPVAQEMPTLKGCESLYDYQERRACTMEKISAHLEKHLDYPKKARREGKEGVAIVAFTVYQDGHTDDYQVREDPGHEMGPAAIKALQKLEGSWVPGRIKGEAVNVGMTIPVTFALSKKEGRTQTLTRPEGPPAIEEMPRFAGCEGIPAKEARICTYEKVRTFILDRMVYPEEAKSKRIEGTVIVKFVVDEKGRVKDPEIVESLGYGCDAEALRLIKAMPDWAPANQDGKPVKTEMKLPFTFDLPDPPKDK